MTRLFEENGEKEPGTSHRSRLWSTVNRGGRHAVAALDPASKLARVFWAKQRGLRPGRGEGYGSGMRIASLREQLARYQPADAAEAHFVERMVELSEVQEACARSHFVPGHFTASAFVLSPDRRELILIHHRKLGIWVQPGGHIDATDLDLESAARREVGEEVGLHDLDALLPGGALFDVDIHAIPARKDEPAHEHFDVRFAFVARTRDFQRSEEVADVRWVALTEARAVTTDRSVLRAVEKLLALVA
jgi:8-oxo-dGTP pyrophosphatase MutT (NUDIX family)